MHIRRVMVLSTQKSKFLHKKYNKIKKLGSAHKVVFFISRKSRSHQIIKVLSVA